MDRTTEYLGLQLKSPLMPSAAAPLTEDLDNIKGLEDAGAGPIALQSIFAEQLTGAQIEEDYLSIVKAVRADVTIPLAVKLSPYFTNLGNMAMRLDQAGAKGLILFNRFMQADISPEELEVWPHVVLSNHHESLLPMRWLGLLYGRINADLAATTGIQKGRDAVKMLMVGTKVTQVCSPLLRHGIGHLREIERELVQWWEEHEYHSVKQAIGTMSQMNVADRSAYEGAQYMKVIQSFDYDQAIVTASTV